MVLVKDDEGVLVKEDGGVLVREEDGNEISSSIFIDLIEGESSITSGSSLVVVSGFEMSNLIVFGFFNIDEDFVNDSL